MRFDQLPQFHRNAKRFARILAVFGKYGLAGWLGGGDPKFIRRWFTDGDGRELAGQPFGERLCGAFLELGPTFIKLGQACSTRADLVGVDTAKALEGLQGDVPGDDMDAIRQTILETLGRPLEDIYAAFDPVPIGSASIGQVHAAQLHDGRAVVVKVRHRGIERRMQDDLEILSTLAGFADEHSEALRRHRPRLLVAEFRRHLLHELDFRREMRNMLILADRFGEHPHLVIPEPYREFSGDRVLTMEKLAGVTLGQWHGTPEQGRTLAGIGANLYADMIFREGVFHADPHPGNIMILPDGRIGLVDFGVLGYLDDELREQLVRMLLATTTGDAQSLARICARVGSAPADLDQSMLGSDLNRFLADYTTLDIGSIEVSQVLDELLRLINRHRIILPPGIAHLIKVLVSLEGSARLLDPSFSLAATLEPYQVELVKHRFSPRESVKRMRRLGHDWQRLLGALPGDVEDLLWRLREGNFELQVEHHRLEDAANRLVAGIICAAMLLGGSYLLGSALPPTLLSISIPGLAMILVGTWLAWSLLRAIRRAGGLDSKRR